MLKVPQSTQVRWYRPVVWSDMALNFALCVTVADVKSDSFLSCSTSDASIHSEELFFQATLCKFVC